VTLRTEVSETSEHDIDPECHLVAIEIETSAAGKDRSLRTKVKGLIAKVAVAVFGSDAHDVVKRILNSTTGVPTSQNIAVGGAACVSHAAEEKTELILVNGQRLIMCNARFSTFIAASFTASLKVGCE